MINPFSNHCSLNPPSNHFPPVQPSMLRPWLRQCPRTVRALCPRCQRDPPRFLPIVSNQISRRSLQTSTADSPDRIPLRKQLKQDAKSLKAHKRQRRESEEASRQKWELTVGIEIHAQLNTDAKLFSRMLTYNRICENMLLENWSDLSVYGYRRLNLLHGLAQLQRRALRSCLPRIATG